MCFGLQYFKNFLNSFISLFVLLTSAKYVEFCCISPDISFRIASFFNYLLSGRKLKVFSSHSKLLPTTDLQCFKLCGISVYP